jgi:hypothetical protein
VIDPALDYATYLGGTGYVNATGVAVDGRGQEAVLHPAE